MTDTNTPSPSPETILSWIQEAREQLALFGTPVWGSTDAQTDADHIADLSKMLQQGRERFLLNDKTEMHSLRLMGEDGVSYVTCLTGNTPFSGPRARALAGYLMSMPFMLDMMEDVVNGKIISADLDQERIKELIESNNEKLFENRAQRVEIKKLEAQVAWLMERIPGIYSAPESDQA